LKRNKDFGQTDLVEILKSNARNRYNHTDIVQAADLIEKSIKWVPKHRIRAVDALSHPFFDP